MKLEFGQNAKNGSEMSVPGWKVFLSHGTVIIDIWLYQKLSYVVHDSWFDRDDAME